MPTRLSTGMRRTMGPSKRVNSKDVCFLSDLIPNSSDALGEIGYKSITQLEKSEAQLQCDEVREKFVIHDGSTICRTTSLRPTSLTVFPRCPVLLLRWSFDRYAFLQAAWTNMTYIRSSTSRRSTSRMTGRLIGLPNAVLLFSIINLNFTSCRIGKMSCMNVITTKRVEVVSMHCCNRFARIQFRISCDFCSFCFILRCCVLHYSAVICLFLLPLRNRCGAARLWVVAHSLWFSVLLSMRSLFSSVSLLLFSDWCS